MANLQQLLTILKPPMGNLHKLEYPKTNIHHEDHPMHWLTFPAEERLDDAINFFANYRAETDYPSREEYLAQTSKDD